jgi:hypothetical protein
MIPHTSIIPGGNATSVAARIAVFATDDALTGGNNSDPITGICDADFAFLKTCKIFFFILMTKTGQWD